MADNTPITSLNSELISAGLNPNDPTNTYVDFASQIAKNQQEQAAQEQALALAKQHVVQAQLQTRQQTEADQAGINPAEKGYMTKANAISQAKLILDQKGLHVNEDVLDAWASTLPDMVPSEQVETFASRFMTERAHMGQPFQATAADAKTDKADENGDTLVAGQMYATVYDNSMKTLGYIRAGKEPVDPSLRVQAHDADLNRKEWRELNTHIDSAFKTRSGGLGSLITAIYRAVRAINTLKSHSTLTAQDLANVSQDVAGIYQGGAPTVVSAKENDYRTAFADLANVVRRFTGIILDASATVEETRGKLLQVLTDLRDSAIQNFKIWMESQAAGYQAVINTNPAQWEKMKQDKLDAVASGLLLTPEEKTQTNITGANLATASKNPNETASIGTDAVDALAKTLGLKKKSVGK